MHRLLLGLPLLFLAACGSGDNKETRTAGQAATTTTAAARPAAPQSNLGEPATGNLGSLLIAYYELKDALVATDTAKADAAASRVLSAAETMRHNNGTPIAAAGVNDRLETIMKQSEAVMNTKSEGVEGKRAAFEKVSDAMYTLLQSAGYHSGGVYRQYCPMAFNDKGAYWLSGEEEIRNPYFGKKMLGCGEVTDSL